MTEPDVDLELVPARMINEYVYCPRLAYIEWVEGDFKDNFFTVEGRYEHRRVDQPTGNVPDPEECKEKEGQPAEVHHARSVFLSAPRAGIVARIDLVEAEGLRVTPIDYKRGSPPDVPDQCYDSDKVQLCAQAMVLEENGYECAEGMLYFAQTKRRVPVTITDELRALTLRAVADLRAMAFSGQLPPALLNSPKCQGCSLSMVCLPDEIAFIRHSTQRDEPRRLFPSRDDALPLHVQAQGGVVGLRGESLKITTKGQEPLEVRIRDISQLAVYGNIQVTTPALRCLCEHGVPVCFFSSGGWFYGMFQGMPHRNILLRRLQYAAASQPERSLIIARSLVEQKIRNQRTMLRRNHPHVSIQALKQLRHLCRQAAKAASLGELLGIEGSAARVYFSHFGGMLRQQTHGELDFAMAGRNRRPPKDPVNALLSLVYAILTKELTIILAGIGFDPHCGFYHQPRYGRPSLALDLMEPFRPLLGDSVVLGAINNGAIQPKDFIKRLGAVALTEAGRRRFIQAYERRMDELVTHPIFGYRISYRRILEVQARLMGRWLAGEITKVPSFVTR